MLEEGTWPLPQSHLSKLVASLLLVPAARGVAEFQVGF